MSLYPLWRIKSWPADDRSGPGTERVVLAGSIPVDTTEIVRELTFRLKQDFNTLPDDWAAFEGEWLQRGTWISCELTDDGSFEPNYTFTVSGIVDTPALGAVYTNNGATFTVIWWELAGGDGTLKLTRTAGTAEPALSGTLTKTSGAGDATIAFAKYKPHTVEKFYGTIHEVGPARNPAGATEIEVTCYDQLVPVRTNGLNLSRACRVLLYETTWDWDSAAWVAGDDVDFLVDIPDNGEEWASGGIVFLQAYPTTNLDEDNEGELKEYGPEEYDYSAGRKQLIFHNSQAGLKDNANALAPPDSPGANKAYQWKLKLYYYDPDDDTTTVKNILLDILQGLPWGPDGGCGIPLEEIDLAEIMGFDASGIVRDQYGYSYAAGTPRKVRQVNLLKIDGPPLQYLDQLRDEGLLPRDYWIRFEPGIRKVIGRYMLQDEAATYIPPFGTEADEQPVTVEGIAGRCEAWCKSLTLKDFAQRATITYVTPTADSPGSGVDGSAYDVRGETAFLVDGKPDTGFGFGLQGHYAGLRPQGTGPGCIVLDILQAEDVQRIQVTASVPRLADGKTEIGRWYKSHRLPKLTISASLDPISDTNPGIPVSKRAISVQYDPLNAGASGGVDIDVECETLTRMRYVAIRWEQDFYGRNSDKPTGGGHASRLSLFMLSCIKLLGDGHIRYLDGPDQGQVPYAQITQKGGTITALPGGLKVRIPAAEAARFELGDLVRLWDTSATAPFAGMNTVAGVDPVTGDITLTAALPVGLTPGDKLGWYRRWLLGLSSATDWRDFYYPQLWRKLENTTRYVEIVEDDSASEASEAEGLAVERLDELVHIQKDHSLTVPLDLGLHEGSTIRTWSGEPDWLVMEATYTLTADPELPQVSFTGKGTDYEGVPR